MKIIIFGGTKEAREIASNLHDLGHELIFSLAGRTSNPTLPKSIKIIIGGFGGEQNLSDYFIASNFDLILDITHPYAQNISNQLVKAASLSSKKLVRFKRPIWQKTSKLNWQDFASFEQAIEQLPTKATVFITTGHKGLELLQIRMDCKFIVRLIEKPKITLNENCSLIINNPPYDLEQEISLMKNHNITHLISKNSGANQTKGKIEAANKLDIDIFMIKRPKLAPAEEFISIKQLTSNVFDLE